MEESTDLVSVAVAVFVTVVIFGIVMGILGIVFVGMSNVEETVAFKEAELTIKQIEAYNDTVLSGAQVTSVVTEYSNHDMGFIVHSKVPTITTIYLGRELTTDGIYYEISGSNHNDYSGNKIEPTTVFDVTVVYNRNEVPIGMIFQGRNIEGSGP